MFYGCVVSSDLYSFQAIALLKPCVKFFKHSIFLFIVNLINGIYRIVLIIFKFTSITLEVASIITQSFFVTNEPLLYTTFSLFYISERTISKFSVNTGGCGDRSAIPVFPSCGACSVVFPVIFVLNLIDLPSKSLSSTSPASSL